MGTKPVRLWASLLCTAALAAPSAAAAHTVTVDGSAAEWLTRAPNAANLGLVARDSLGQGEYVWRDAPADTRTDIAAPEVVADIIAFQVTGNANGVGFLLRRAPGVSLAGAPIQVQIAIDLDRVAGSGQSFFAEFADTQVADGARWERLVETLFGSGGTAKVIDGSFNQVAMVPAVQGASGDVEIFVPWSALGLNAPPAVPLRFTVATFRAQPSDLTIDIGGSMFSNALDVIGDYGDPAASAYPNTFQDVQDLTVDYSFDVHFGGNGEVIAPLVVKRFLANSSGGGSDEWYAVTNVTPAPLPLAGFKLGDEETPDGAEGMFTFPPGATVAAGATFTVARSGAAFQAFFGAAPDAELPPGASMAVPDMAAFPAWTSAAIPNLQLANAGDELLVLDASNTLLDIAVFGTGVYAGITSFTPAPGTDDVLARDAASNDTDNCQVDFSNLGDACTTDAQCGGVCKQCSGGACGNTPQGAACPDANACNGAEICDGLGACVASAPPSCDDGAACTTDTCAPATGCVHTTVPAGTPCADANLCDGAEACDAAGACVAGAALDCEDLNACTSDACDPATGCTHASEPQGASCDDGDSCTGPDTCDGNGQCASGEGGCGGSGGAGGTGGGTGGAGGAGTGGAGGTGTSGAGGGATTTGAGGSSTGAGGGASTTSTTSTTATTSGAGGGGGVSAKSDSTADEGGCGCRAAGSGARPAPFAWLAGLALLAAAMRRRRSGGRGQRPS